MDELEITTLPLPLNPYPDEALPGFLLRVAAQNGIAVGRLLNVIGMNKQPPYQLLAIPDDEPRGRMAALMGLSVDQVERMELVPPIDRGWTGAKAATLTGSFGVLRAFSRACPACLAERPGWWRQSWRVAGIVACTRHGLLLRGRCAACGGRWFAGGARDSAAAPTAPYDLSTMPPADGLCMAEVDGKWCAANVAGQDAEPADAETLETQRMLIYGYLRTVDWWYSEWSEVWERIRKGLLDLQQPSHPRLLRVPVEVDDGGYLELVAVAIRRVRSEVPSFLWSPEQADKGVARGLAPWPELLDEG